MGLLVLVLGCSDDSGPEATGPSEAACGSVDGERCAVSAGAGAPVREARWEQLPDPPLSGRLASMVASIGDRIYVAGGWDFLCPPGASCVAPTDPPFRDGALFSLETGEWSAIADAPLGVMPMATAVFGEDIYVANACVVESDCPDGESMLRYRSADDAWEVLPGVEDGGIPGDKLLATDGGVVAYWSTEERGERTDHRFLPGEERWAPLPDDPLPALYDRFMVEHEGRLYLFGSPVARGEERTKLAAVYDPGTDAWQELSDAGTQGYQVWRIGARMYLNPHFGRNAGPGGVYEPGSDTWEHLPEPPDVDSWRNDMAGILGHDEAFYEYANGWVLDTRDDTWLEIEPHPDVAVDIRDDGIPAPPNQTTGIYQQVVAVGPDRTLILFGGERWIGGEGELFTNTWQWTP